MISSSNYITQAQSEEQRTIQIVEQRVGNQLVITIGDNYSDRSIEVKRSHFMQAVQKDKHADLRDRTKAYASRIIRLYIRLRQSHHFDDAAMMIGKQLLRSGTSTAANHREAKHARSKADRIAKFSIILQELEESALWLELLIEHRMAHVDSLNQITG